MNLKKILLSTYGPKMYAPYVLLLKKSGQYDVKVEDTYEKSISSLKEEQDLLILTSKIGSINPQTDDIGRKLGAFGIPIKLADKALELNPSQKILYLDSTSDLAHQEYNGQTTTLDDFLKRKKDVAYHKLYTPIEPKILLETVNKIIQQTSS
jgi:hypothetical protein